MSQQPMVALSDTSSAAEAPSRPAPTPPRRVQTLCMSPLIDGIGGGGLPEEHSTPFAGLGGGSLHRTPTADIDPLDPQVDLLDSSAMDHRAAEQLLELLGPESELDKATCMAVLQAKGGDMDLAIETLLELIAAGNGPYAYDATHMDLDVDAGAREPTGLLTCC